MLRNFIPSSTATVSGSVIVLGVVVGVKIEQGQVVDEAVSVSDAVLVAPFSVAITTAVLFDDSVPARAVNAAEDWPALMVIDVGTVSNVLLSDRPTVVALVAALDSVTVQIALAPEASDDGEQANELNVTPVTSEMDAVRDTPPNVAVTTAVLFPDNVPARAVKVAEDWPAATETDAGMVSNELLSDKLTVVELEAALDNVTVQVALAPEASDDGEQANELNVAEPDPPT